jgi:hypothetical protein
MVDRSYMVKKPPPPSAVTQFVHQRAFPVAIDAAAAMEQALNRAAIAARGRPLIALGLALGIGGVMALLATRRRVA